MERRIEDPVPDEHGRSWSCWCPLQSGCSTKNRLASQQDSPPRRHLTAEEAQQVGRVEDVRGTPEQTLRFEAMRLVLPPGLADRLGPL